MLRIAVFQKSPMSSGLGGFDAKWIDTCANFAQPNLNPNRKSSEVRRYPNYPDSPHKSTVITVTGNIIAPLDLSSQHLPLYIDTVYVCVRESPIKYIYDNSLAVESGWKCTFMLNANTVLAGRRFPLQM